MKELYKWLVSDPAADNDTFAIHLSHDDLDGYGCQLVSHVAQNICAMKNMDRNNLINENMDYNPAHQHRAIRDTIDAASRLGYTVGKDRLYFLVTDISRFNPAIFQDYMKDHVINWIVIDHHPDPDNFNALDQKTFAEDGTLIPCADNRMMITPGGCSAAMLVYNLMIEENCELHALDNVPLRRELRKIVEAISDSDTGHWGTWADTLTEEMPESLALCERLNFERYTTNGIEDRWVMDTMLRLPGIDPIDYFTAQMSTAMFNYPLIVKDYWGHLGDLYRSMDEHTQQMSKIELGKFKGFGELKVYQYIPEPGMNAGHLFSPLSAEWLRKHPDVDVLLIHYPERGEYSLRSRDGGPDCSVIARQNGGGGHPRASGFRDPQSTNE